MGMSDAENYKNTLRAYYKCMLQLPPQREWMKHKFGLRVRDLFDAKKDLKFLSIGGGAGDVDVDFLNEIVKCGKERLGYDGYSVLYTVVEPNSANVEAFRKLVGEQPHFNRIQFKWHTATFEKFCDEFKGREKEENKFDFVHFVRCFYHIDSAKSFDRTYNHLLTKNGIMCGVGENENAFWPRMMHFLADHKIDHPCFQCSGPVSQNYFLPGWINLSLERGWKYESYVHGYDFDLTPAHDPSSETGNYIMDFMFHQRQSRKNQPQSVIDDLFQFFKKNQIERVVLKDGEEIKEIIYPC